MNNARIALVTGANQGLGRALAEGLAARMEPADLVLLTGRNQQRVAAAAAEIAAAPGTHSQVQGRVLDVADPDAIAALAAELRETYGGVDIVLSNATTRLLPDQSQSAMADEYIDVANTATHTILRTFTPILRPGGRLFVVASSLGTLGHLPEQLRPLFDNATLDQVEYAVESWRSAIHSKTAEEAGWPRWLNTPSKVAQVAAVRAVAAERRAKDLGTGTLIASICPGMVDTATSRPWFSDFSEAQTPAEAASAVVDLALTPGVDPDQYGELIQFGKVVPWHSGTPLDEQALQLIP
ncbi:SDR family NAD(P)-dependent oxidoreductase [Nocardia sp. NPDC051321]|uniref:SDR family NAD(P)-dependent oxidoreductase n=1 Tax=Nocardia sp. NPDC051321 TaxID=3364323 RepID=UPI00379E6793